MVADSVLLGSAVPGSGLAPQSGSPPESAVVVAVLQIASCVLLLLFTLGEVRQMINQTAHLWSQQQRAACLLCECCLILIASGYGLLFGNVITSICVLTARHLSTPWFVKTHLLLALSVLLFVMVKGTAAGLLRMFPPPCPQRAVGCVLRHTMTRLNAYVSAPTAPAA